MLAEAVGFELLDSTVRTLSVHTSPYQPAKRIHVARSKVEASMMFSGFGLVPGSLLEVVSCTTQYLTVRDVHFAPTSTVRLSSVGASVSVVNITVWHGCRSSVQSTSLT
jgi:hypothetical protein